MMRFMRGLHRWLALIISAQVLLWLVSGCLMSLLDAGKVAGEDVVAFEHDEQLVASAAVAEPQAIIAALAPQQPTSLELKRQLGHWVWRAETNAGVILFNAKTGERMAVREADARWVAETGYFGEGRITSVTLLHSASIEARGHSPPLWRVDFDDAARTRYYIAAEDGRLLERRNSTWQLFDFFWMLHTMDYVGRDNYNTPWIIIVAFASLWLAISGTVLLIRSFTRNRV